MYNETGGTTNGSGQTALRRPNTPPTPFRSTPGGTTEAGGSSARSGRDARRGNGLADG